MTDRDSLIRQICLTLADDTPRLIFADWCEDHGETDRAEFIRVQIELARCGDDPRKPCGGYYCDTYDDGTTAHRDCRTARLRDREQELKDTLRIPLWDGEQPADMAGSGAITRRGFYESVTCTAAQWLDHGPAIVQQQPITRVEISDALHMSGRALQSALLAAGIPVELSQGEAALLWARREAGLEVTDGV